MSKKSKSKIVQKRNILFIDHERSFIFAIHYSKNVKAYMKNLKDPILITIGYDIMATWGKPSREDLGIMLRGCLKITTLESLEKIPQHKAHLISNAKSLNLGTYEYYIPDIWEAFMLGLAYDKIPEHFQIFQRKSLLRIENSLGNKLQIVERNKKQGKRR